MFKILSYSNLLFLTLALVSVTFSANGSPANRDRAGSLSGLQHGIICQAIDKKYPNTLPVTNRPGWLNCREEANFMKIDDYYGVTMRLSNDGKILSCTARLKNGPARRQVATVNCKVVRRR